eukprot:890901-Rhodomonas_salina.1
MGGQSEETRGIVPRYPPRPRPYLDPTYSLPRLLPYLVDTRHETLARRQQYAIPSHACSCSHSYALDPELWMQREVPACGPVLGLGNAQHCLRARLSPRTLNPKPAPSRALAHTRTKTKQKPQRCEGVQGDRLSAEGGAGAGGCRTAPPPPLLLSLAASLSLSLSLWRSL